MTDTGRLRDWSRQLAEGERAMQRTMLRDERERLKAGQVPVSQVHDETVWADYSSLEKRVLAFGDFARYTMGDLLYPYQREIVEKLMRHVAAGEKLSVLITGRRYGLRYTRETVAAAMQKWRDEHPDITGLWVDEGQFARKMLRDDLPVRTEPPEDTSKRAKNNPYYRDFVKNKDRYRK